jgi:hypothetical protein
MLRLLISKHFFAYRYDYRTEWLRFIKTVSGIDAGSTLRTGAASPRLPRAMATSRALPLPH